MIELPSVTHSRHHAGADLRPAVTAGALLRVGWDAYLVPATPAESWERRREVSLARCVAACDRLGGQAVVSHVSAALLHGLWVPNLEWPVHTTQPSHTRSPVRTDEHIRHHRPLDDSEVVLIEGLRVTSLTRTVIDTVTALSPCWSLAVADSAMRLVVPATRGAEYNAIRDEQRQQWRVALEERGPRRGRRQARVLLGLADHRAESPNESRARCFAARLGLPTPTPQAAVAVGTGLRFVDLGWWVRRPGVRPHLVALEIDGEVKYGPANSGTPTEATGGAEPEQWAGRTPLATNAPPLLTEGEQPWWAAPQALAEWRAGVVRAAVRDGRATVVQEKVREDAIREALSAQGIGVTFVRAVDDLEEAVDRVDRALARAGATTRRPVPDLYPRARTGGYGSNRTG